MAKSTLTPEEEIRFDELFAPSDRLALSHDWAGQLQAEITKTRPQAAPNYAPSEDGETPILLSDELHAKRSDRDAEERPSRLPFAMAACLLLVVLGVGFVALQPDRASDQITLIPASQQVPAPEFSDVAIPEGTTSIGQTSDGTTVAVVPQREAGVTVLALSDDLETWTETTPIPVVGFDSFDFLAVDTSTDTWFVVGGDPDTLFDAGLAPESQNLATDLLVFSSVDRGQSWTEIEAEFATNDFERTHGQPLPSFSAETPLLGSMAVLGDRLLVLVESTTLTNWTEAARSAGIVDNDTQVFLSGAPPFPGEEDEQTFQAVGPEGIREVIITADDLSLSEEAFDELKLGLFFSPPGPNDDLDASAFRFFLSEAGSPFERASDPRIGPFPSVFTQGERFVAQSETPSEFSDEFLRRVRVSTDGTSWSKSDDDTPVHELVYALTLQDVPQEFGNVIDGDLWGLRIEPGSEGAVRLEQSNGGNTAYSLAPAPEADLQPELAFTTDFGAAVVWQNPALEVPPVATVVENGWTFEARLTSFTFTLTDPEGNQSGNRSLFGSSFDNVVIDENLTVWVFDDDGSELASFSFDEVGTAALRTESEIQRVVSWATGPNDWRFAELEGLSISFWIFQPIDQGLLATAPDDPTEALLIEWPDEFE